MENMVSTNGAVLDGKTWLKTSFANKKKISEKNSSKFVTKENNNKLKIVDKNQ